MASWRYTVGMSRSIAVRRVAAGASSLRRRWVKLRDALGRVDWLVVPPARTDAFGSATIGEEVTSSLVTWARTVASWSVLATLGLGLVWLAKTLVGL